MLREEKTRSLAEGMPAAAPIYRKEHKTIMTERIFDRDAYCRIFSATVIACREEKDHFAVLLDRTAFYPEGGGQSGDTGILKYEETAGRELPAGERQIRVIDTQENGERIWHLTERPVKVGSRVEGEIDWEARFDRMQNHTGEHIVSGLIHAAYGHQNVGFHMGTESITIDLSGELTMEQLQQIERRANEVIWHNVEVITDCCSEEEAAGRQFRSKKELHGIVRIVTIPGADVCACCGTHVRRTGEVGLIRILSCEKFRGGVRVEMVCGKRAYNYDTEVFRQNHEISVALSAKPLETAKAVLRTKANMEEAVYKVIGLEQKLFEMTATSLQDKGNVLISSEEMTPDNVRKLAVAVMEKCGGKCAVFAGSDQGGYKYAIGQTGGDLRALVKEVNASLNGRGGGKPFFAQGSVSAGLEQIREFFGALDETWESVTF